MIILCRYIDAKIRPDSISSSPSFRPNTGAITGQVIDSKTNLPVCFADISCSDKTIFTKSNSKGEFLISPPELPTTLKIRKFGYKDESILVSTSEAPVMISLTPFEIFKKSGKVGSVQYSSLLKRAIEKLRKKAASASLNRSERELVYCRITSSVDSTLNSFFESYAEMIVSGNSLQEYQSRISRFASTGQRIPGLSANRLELNIDRFIRRLSTDIVKYINYTGFFEQEGNPIAFGGLVLGETETVYYINVADTSIMFIRNLLKSEKKFKSGGPLQTLMENRITSTEISFSPCTENNNCYRINCITENDTYILIQKDKPDKTISKSTLFAVIPDFSTVNNAVKDYVINENLTGSKQQINYTGKYSLSERIPLFDSETKKLLLKPYNPDFWAQNTLINPDSQEQKQILIWENGNRFYSENSLTVNNQPGVDSLVTIMNKNIAPVEKVYLETDRHDYLAGDTIWFSAFVLGNRHMDSTSMSKILYVDLITAENKLAKQLKLLIKNGRANGDFALNKDLKNGIFRIRAYTLCMRNFQSEYFFEKDIPVFQSDINNLIVVNPVINKSGEGDSVNLFMQVLLPVRYRELEKELDVFIRLNDSMSVRKSFNFKEDFSGSMRFIVPSSISCSFADIKFTLTDTAFISEQRLSVPLKPGIDLQFFPESGKLVAGFETVIAWKAEDKKGNPAEFEADITDENQNILTHISGNKSGVGKFSFTPHLNQIYKAVVTLSGNKYVFSLPATEPIGYVLTFNPDSSLVRIKNNLDISNSRHYVMVSVRGTVYTAIEAKLNNTPVWIDLPFETYPKGIVQITLFDSMYRPLAERLVFNNRSDQKMLIHVESDKKDYRPREKVNLTINVSDASGNPVESSLAMSVVDASKTDSLASFADIESYLYLASELKGKIDYKLFNLADTTQSGNRNIDLVMMTQGWRNYLWNSIRYSKTLNDFYPIEKGFYLDGSVLNSNNQKSITDYNLNFFDAKTFYNDVVKVSEKGSFKIEFPLFYNTHFIVIQNKNKKGKIDDLRFTLDTFPVPGINIRNNEIPFISYKPGYLKAIGERFAEVEPIIESPFKDILLKEVTVTAKKLPFYFSKPKITVNLDKTDPTGKKYNSLFGMIRQEFGEKAFTAHNGFACMPILVRNGNPTAPNSDWYPWASGAPVDEISNVKFFEAGCEYSQFFGLFPVRDMQVFLPVVSYTTYEDSYRGNPKGTIVIPFQGIYRAKEFYQPDYEHNKSNKPDTRTTIYWNPEVKTDSTGKANVSFYNSDMKGKAVIRVSGVSYQLKDASSVVSDYGSK